MKAACQYGSDRRRLNPQLRNHVEVPSHSSSIYMGSFVSEPIELQPANGTLGTTIVSGVFRWLSKDPIGILGGLNQYVFVGNNPVNYLDPFGLQQLLIHAKRAGGCSGASGSGSAGWGHAWVTLVNVNGNQTSYGFWPGGPNGGASPFGALSGKHYKGNLSISTGVKDSDYCADETYVVDIDLATYNRLIKGVSYFQKQGYTWALSYNCTDFAGMVGQWAGVNVGNVNTMGWSDPDMLADWIVIQNKQKSK